MPRAPERLPLGVCVVRPTKMTVGGSRLKYSIGISRETCDATQLAMSLVIVPAGGAARPHYHLATATIVHVLKGRAETRYGRHLGYSVISKAGDFLYIGAHVPHAPRNLSATEESVALNARNDPAQQEPVVPVEKSDESRLAKDLEIMQIENPPPDIVASLNSTLGKDIKQFGVASKGFLLTKTIFPPKADARERIYPDTELGVFVAQGEFQLQFGNHCEHKAAVCSGQFLFIPTAVRHRWLNTNKKSTLLIARLKSRLDP